MITEIFVENKKLDVYADISSLLTFAIDDVKDFASRSTVYSKSVVLPGTANNNAVFGNIFETGISNAYDPSQPNIGYNFNPSISARCIVFQDNLQTFKGALRLTEIIKDGNRIEYEVALSGELATLKVALSSRLLSDLDFTAYNQEWTIDNITDSWDNAPGSGVFFPLIDYGTYSINKHDWDFRTFRPALYVKEYIDKIFTAANFRYSSDLFNTNRFKSLVIPNNQKDITRPRTGVVLTASKNDTQQIIDTGTDLEDDNISFSSYSGGLFTLTGSKEFEYTGAATISTIVSIDFEGYYRSVVDPSFDIIATLYKNGSEYYPAGGSVINITHNSTNNPYSRHWEIPMTLNTGDTLKINFKTSGSNFFAHDAFVESASISINSQTVVAAPLEYGELIDFAYCMPQNIRQIDFLLSIVKLFNLYIYESKFEDRMVYITPFIDFYPLSSGNAVDWTFKLNRAQPIKIKPLSELNSKVYEFNYKEDSDYYNDLYKKRYNQGYGSRIYDTQFEFASQTNKLELIFAATPLVGYQGEEKVYSTIFKRSGETEERVDSVIRILQTNKISGVLGYQIKNGNTNLRKMASYGYAGHFNDPDNPDNDLNFGLLKEYFFRFASADLTKTQFNVYWSGYMAEITDKDSKMLAGKFYLTPKDIFDLEFSKYVYVDGVLFRLNKILDYNASKPADCRVELLKVINTSYSFPPGEVPETFYWIDEDAGYVLDDDNSKIPTNAG